jgi:hypothetical protein
VLCVQKNCLNDAKFLLETYKANPNGCNFCLISPLGAAIQNNNKELVKLLLDYNASPSHSITHREYVNGHFIMKYPIWFCMMQDILRNGYQFKLMKSNNTDFLSIFWLLLKNGANPRDLLTANYDIYLRHTFFEIFASREEINIKNLVLKHFHKYMKILQKFEIDRELLKLVYTLNTYPYYKNSFSGQIALLFDADYVNTAKLKVKEINFNEIDCEIRDMFFSISTLEELCRYRIRDIINTNKNRKLNLDMKLDTLSQRMPQLVLDYLKHDR